MRTEPVPENIRRLERPNPALWAYYLILSVVTGPGIVVMLPYLFFRYHTLRYRFDEEGIHMKVGLLFRREINLTYARIQDIHLRSGILQRWLGLANVQIQTASGSAGPELVVEGFKEFEAIRDFLYTRMRGYLFHPVSAAASAHEGGANVGSDREPADAEVVMLLTGIRDELRRAREILEARQAAQPPLTQTPRQEASPHV